MAQWVSVLMFCVIHAQLLLCIALRHESRRGADSLSTVKSTSEHENASLLAHLRAASRKAHTHHTTRIAHVHCGMAPGVSHCASHVGLDVRSEFTAPCTVASLFNTFSTTHSPYRSLAERLSHNAGDGLVSRNKVAGQSSVSLCVRLRGDACMIPVLSRRAWLSSRRLKPTTGNQKLTILDINSA